MNPIAPTTRDIWLIILQKLEYTDKVHLILTCKWLRLHFDTQIAPWRKMFQGSKRSTLLSDKNLIAAAASGDLSLVRSFTRYAKYIGWAVYTASINDHPHIIEYLRTCYTKYNLSCYHSYWVTNIAVPPSLAGLINYSKEGYFEELVIYGRTIRTKTLTRETPTSLHILQTALLYNDSTILTDNWVAWFTANFSHFEYGKAFRIAAQHGNFDILEKMTCVINFNTNTAIPCGAALGGYYNIFAWWHEQSTGQLYEYGLYYNAVRGGNIDIINMVFDNKKRLRPNEIFELYVQAVINGRLDIIKLLMKNFRIKRIMRLKRIARRHHKPDIYDYLKSLQ